MSSTSNETEIALYAKIDDPESLKEAEFVEDHIQLESTLISGARIRVRKITPVKGPSEGGADRYEITLKIKQPMEAGIPSSMETTQETDRGFFEAFAEVAHRAIVKRRYRFTGKAPTITGAENVVIPAVHYEVDQFVNPETKARSEWIKIDIELDGVLQALEQAGIDTHGLRQRFNLKTLPFTSENMFSAQSATPEQKELLGKLWETEFSQKLAPDEYVKGNETQPVENVPSQAPEQSAAQGTTPT